MTKILKFGCSLLLSLSLSLFMNSCCKEDCSINEVEKPQEGTHESNENETNEFDCITLNESQKILSNKTTCFAGNLFGTLIHEDMNENVVFSPLCCQWCLSMLANACQGKAYDQIIEVLGFEGFSRDEINDYNALLTSEIKSMDSKVTIESANGFFQLPTIASYVTKDYKELLRESYKADILTSGNMITSINHWVDEKTHGQIPNLYNDEKDDLSLVVLGLVNALYFKGPWSVPFDSKDTFKGKFNLSDGGSTDVEYMSDKLCGAVYDYGMAKSLEFELGNGSFCFEVLLPNEDVDINEFTGNLDLNKRETTGPFSIDFEIPKFSLCTNFQLVNVLKDMGVLYIFEGGKTDFTPMLGNFDTSGISLGDIRQGCGIRIDENGVSAASATSAVLGPTASGGIQETLTFHVNRPFLFLLKEYCTNSILIMGKIENPQQ